MFACFALALAGLVASAANASGPLPTDRDPTLLPFSPVLLYDWPVWKSPTLFHDDVWVISGLHNVLKDSEPLARRRAGHWMLYAQPLRYPSQLAADDTGMLVAGDDNDRVAVRRAGEAWRLVAPPVPKPARRDGVPGLAYVGGEAIVAFLGPSAWILDWDAGKWSPLELRLPRGSVIVKLALETRERWFMLTSDVDACAAGLWGVHSPHDAGKIRVEPLSLRLPESKRQVLARCRALKSAERREAMDYFGVFSFLETDGSLGPDEQSATNGLRLVGRCGNLYWEDTTARTIDAPLREMRQQPEGTAFVRVQKSLHMKREDGKLEALPFLPFVEFLRDDYIGAPVGSLQINANGELFQVVEGHKADRSAVVKLAPAVGAYPPIANLPGRPEPFLLRGQPAWRAGSSIWSLDGDHKIADLPDEFVASESRGRNHGAPAALFSRTETILRADNGIYRREGASWKLADWKILGIAIVERFHPATVQLQSEKPTDPGPEFDALEAVDGSVFFWRSGSHPFVDLEPRVLDLSHIEKGLAIRKLHDLPAPRALMPATAGSIREGSRVAFFDDDAVYWTDDVWEEHWQGFMGFTPYFRARGHVFRAEDPSP
jgi:hypothetical protein